MHNDTLRLTFYQMWQKAYEATQPHGVNPFMDLTWWQQAILYGIVLGIASLLIWGIVSLIRSM